VELRPKAVEILCVVIPVKKDPATSLHPQPGVHKSGTLTPSNLKPKPDSDKLTPDS